MTYRTNYDSPLGKVLLTADEAGLTGLCFYGEKYFPHDLYEGYIQEETEILAESKKWLDEYFGGSEPNFTPPLHPAGSEFRHEVWDILLQIPYGKTTTYG